MYLLNAAARSNTKWGLSGAYLSRRRGLGLIPAMVDRSSYQYYTNGGSTPYNPFVTPPKAIIPTKTATTTTVTKAPVSNLVYAKESPITAPKPLPIRVPLPILPKPPAPAPPPAPVSTAGTPVPSNYPTNQFYVANDGSVWEFSSSTGKWFNTVTPYSAPGATPTTTAITPAPSAGSSGAVVAPSTPVNVSVSPAADTGYQAILDWLTQDTLLGTFGISGIPNWLTGSVVGLVGYKLVSAKGGR